MPLNTPQHNFSQKNGLDVPRAGGVVTPPAPPPSFDRRLIKIGTMRPEAAGLLASMRIRKKLVVLHTLFSVALGALLVVALRPAINDVVASAEREHARLALGVYLESSVVPANSPRAEYVVRVGTPAELGVPARSLDDAFASPGQVVNLSGETGTEVAAVPVAGGNAVWLRAELPVVRAAAVRFYILLIVALLVAYGLVAVTLELLVLPQNLYAPIQRLLFADSAVQSGNKEDELIPEAGIPGDELGEIMRSRNETVINLRRQEAALASALSQLEHAAGDLKRKNHLLETAQRNLAESDRLVSLGMMSAGIAHELNTPLSVLKGCVEQIGAAPGATVDPARAALMLRVVNRLEKLSESLLDFARVRPPTMKLTNVREIVSESVTLVMLDRDARGVTFTNEVDPELMISCDGDRMVQVFVNVVRNAVDALTRGRGETSAGQGSVTIQASTGERGVAITITDDGPGIDPAVLATLFEPFTSTRLDSRGTGLGLAVAEGIAKEHGGLLVAYNRTDRSGAVFEVTIPG
jgi:signal transduction histidine kinase